MNNWITLSTDPIYIEICLECIYHKSVVTLSTTSWITDISSIKVFAHNEAQQAFILSGPEVEEKSEQK